MADTGLNHWGDILAIILFFLVTLGVAIWSICRPTRESVKGYFLAGGNAQWWAIGLSLFASNIGSEHFISLAGSGAASGIVAIVFEWNAIFLVLLLAWAFLPVYLISGVYTLPEYLSKRFGGQRMRLLVGVIFILSCVLVPGDLYSGGLFIQEALGWNIYLSCLLIIGVSTLYAVLGGLSTVMYTDAIQVVIMLGGAIVVTVIGFQKVGGFEELRVKYMDAVADSVRNRTDNDTRCGFPRDDAWHLFRDPIHADFPSFAIFFRVLLGGVFYWCANQTIVQRCLAAKNIQHAKAGALLASLLKITPLFFMILPGMISRVLFPNEVGCADPDTCMAVCGSRAGCSNVAYPKLVLNILPAGLRGMMLAVMLSAVISSLTSMYNSVATVVSLDMWTKIRPRAKEGELLLVGRLAVLAVVSFSFAWIPVLRNSEGGQLFRYGTAVLGYVGAPLSSTFLLAMFWPWASEQGAFWGFLVATVAGLIRFGLDVAYQGPGCGETDTRPAVVAFVHPYYFTVMQICLGFIISVLISAVTKPIKKSKQAGLTFWMRHQIPEAEQQVEELKNGALALIDRSTSEKDTSNPEQTVELDTLTPKMSADEAEEESSEAYWIIWLKKLCGYSSVAGAKPVKIDSYTTRKAKLQEPRVWKITLNILATLLMTLVICLYIYFR